MGPCRDILGEFWLGIRRIICKMQTLPGISSGDQGGDDMACTG